MDIPLSSALGAPVVAGLEPSKTMRAALSDLDVRFEPQTMPPQARILLRMETSTGQPLDRRTIATCWHRPPYTLTLRLARYEPGSTVAEGIDEAVIGTRGTRDEFRLHLERTAALLVRDAIMGRSRGPCGPNLSSPNLSSPKLGSPKLGGPHLDGPHLDGRHLGSPDLRAASKRGRRLGGRLDHLRSRWSQRFMSEWWSLGVTATGMADIVANAGLGRVTWLSPQKGEAYLADPFPWFGTDRILCEEMPMTGGHGRIVAVSIEGQARSSETILQDAHHHSYPCTFSEAGFTYMLPEATEPGATVLYRLLPNGRLESVCTIDPKRRLGDATLFRHDGLYWIACSDPDIGAYDSLCLLYAEQLHGPWQSHRLNPVRIDVRGARPAGSVFRIGDTLYRPGQNCAATYGAGVTIHTVDVLTPEIYRETPVVALWPDPDGPFPHGLHTLNSDGTRTWIDGKRFVLDWPTLWDKVARRLRVRRLQSAGQPA